MPRKSAQASTSAACMASVLGTPNCRNIRLLNSLKASTGKLFVSTSVMFILDHREIYVRPGTDRQSADGKYVVPCKFASNRKVGHYRTTMSERAQIYHRRGHHRNAGPIRRENCQEQSALADVAFCCGNVGTRQQLAQGRHHNQGIKVRIHLVKRPPSPRGPEPSKLISSERQSLWRAVLAGGCQQWT